MRALNSLGLTLFATTLVVACDSPSGPGSARISETAVLTIEPGNAVVQAGASVKLTATIKDEDGLTTFPVDVSWLSSNQSVAAVHHGGMVQGLSAGQTQISATWKTARGTARVTVTEGTGMRPVSPPCLARAARDHGLLSPRDGGKC
jgi:hypothetical protein